MSNSATEIPNGVSVSTNEECDDIPLLGSSLKLTNAWNNFAPFLDIKSSTGCLNAVGTTTAVSHRVLCRSFFLPSLLFLWLG